MIKNAKQNIQGDFQICISVPLIQVAESKYQHVFLTPETTDVKNTVLMALKTIAMGFYTLQKCC